MMMMSGNGRWAIYAKFKNLQTTQPAMPPHRRVRHNVLKESASLAEEMNLDSLDIFTGDKQNERSKVDPVKFK